MRARVVGLVVSAVVMLATVHTPVQASVWSGSCALNLTFNFGSRVRPLSLSSVSRPSYTISAEAAVDLNPSTTAKEACAITLDALNPFRPTGISASGTSHLWTCEATDARGSWLQVLLRLIDLHRRLGRGILLPASPRCLLVTSLLLMVNSQSVSHSWPSRPTRSQPCTDDCDC